MKKLLTLFLSVLICLSCTFMACGGGNGSNVSSAEALSYLNEVEVVAEDITTESLTKSTFKTRIVFDGEQETSTLTAFSKEDLFYYSSSTSKNLKLYEGIDPSNRTYLGTIHSSKGEVWNYIDDAGRYYDVYSSFDDSTMFDAEENKFVRESDTKKYYTEYPADLDNSTNLFNNSLLVQIQEFLIELMSYNSQMLSTFKPYLQMGDFEIPGMKMTIKSNGDGHLYLSMDMSAAGTTYVVEYKNYMLSYMKSYLDFTKIDDINMGYTTLLTEVFFDYGVCDISYPNLSSFEKVA